RRHTRFSRDWSSDVCSSDLRCRHYDHLRVPRKLRNVSTSRLSDPLFSSPHLGTLLPWLLPFSQRDKGLHRKILPFGTIVDPALDPIPAHIRSCHPPRTFLGLLSVPFFKSASGSTCLPGR